MKANKLKTLNNQIIEGPLLITPNLFTDERGYFYELYNISILEEIVGEEINFVQDNISSSRRGVIRGLHYQINPNPQSKLVFCRKGSIFDVAIDLRKNSKTFGLYCHTYLNEKNKNLFWIPKGFAHGFIALEENTEVQYKVQGLRVIDCERSIIWNDPDLSIKWPILNNKINQIILSEKDRNSPSFKAIIKSGDYFI